jgi:hypothetical protein
MARKLKGNLPRISPEDAKALLDHLDKRIVDFEGNVDDLEAALGAYLCARHVGWKPMALVHNKRTIRKFEQILGIEFRTAFEDEGPDAERSLAYRVAKSLSNFWKAVSGEVPIKDKRVLE